MIKLLSYFLKTKWWTRQKILATEIQCQVQTVFGRYFFNNSHLMKGENALISMAVAPTDVVLNELDLVM